MIFYVQANVWNGGTVIHRAPFFFFCESKVDKLNCKKNNIQIYTQSSQINIKNK